MLYRTFFYPQAAEWTAKNSHVGGAGEARLLGWEVAGDNREGNGHRQGLGAAGGCPGGEREQGEGWHRRPTTTLRREAGPLADGGGGQKETHGVKKTPFFFRIICCSAEDQVVLFCGRVDTGCGEAIFRPPPTHAPPQPAAVRGVGAPRQSGVWGRGAVGEWREPKESWLRLTQPNPSLVGGGVAAPATASAAAAAPSQFLHPRRGGGAAAALGASPRHHPGRQQNVTGFFYHMSSVGRGRGRWLPAPSAAFARGSSPAAQPRGAQNCLGVWGGAQAASSAQQRACWRPYADGSQQNLGQAGSVSHASAKT